ncbi:MAG TPA: serine protease [Candidatus Limnocylindrales bacterium]|nr:serine protease [Candidatus Limnocylindrales bacterium]
MLDKPFWEPSPETIHAWQCTFKDHIVALLRPDLDRDGRGTMVVCGTGTFVRPNGWAAPYILTATHIIPDGWLYAAAGLGGNPIQLDEASYADEKTDIAFIPLSSVLAEFPGKEIVPLEPWPRDPMRPGSRVGVVGYPQATTMQPDGSNEKRLRIHSYGGTVDEVDKRQFKARTYSRAPYPGAVPLDDARGLSGAPVFEILESGSAMIRGVHHGAFVSGAEAQIIANDLACAPRTERYSPSRAKRKSVRARRVCRRAPNASRRAALSVMPHTGVAVTLRPASSSPARAGPGRRAPSWRAS